MTGERGGCQREVLARGPHTELARCSCGHVHLSVGPVTLRLDEGLVQALFLTLREALPQLAPAKAGAACALPGSPGRAGGWKQ